MSAVRFFLICLFYFFVSACGESNSFRAEDRYILNVSGESFEIPKGYVWRYDSIRDHQIQGPNLHTLYPDFEPMTSSNKYIFESRGWAGGRLVMFLIKEQAKSKSIERIIENAISEGIVKKYVTDSDLTVYTHYIRNREFIVGKWSNGSPTYFSCQSIEAVPFPSCRTRVIFNSDILIHITFPRSLLDEWEQLCAGLLIKVREFRDQYSLMRR